MLDFSIYLSYRAFSAIIAVLPLRLVFGLGRVLGTAAWLCAAKYRHLAQRNLRIAFGDEKSAREVRQLARRHFENLGANLLSGVKLNSLPLERIATLIDVEGIDELDRELRAGRGVVLALSHVGNWELFTRISPHYFGSTPLAAVYQRLGNRCLDRHVSAQRARFGVQPLDRREGFQQAIQLLRKGGLLGILSDQHAGDHGLWTPFFSRLASTSPLPGLLSKRTGAALFAAAVYTEGRARWRVVFTRRLDAPGQTVEALTANTNAVIEQQIRRAPQDWFWVHNRWKTPQPHFLLTQYKRGVFVPEQTGAARLKPFRILIRTSNWLGDSVITMPAVRAIKAGRPDAHITIAAPEKLAAVWRLLPEVDDVVPLNPRSLFSAAGALWRRDAFEVAILFPNSLRVALEAWLAGVPRRVGYRGHHRVWLLNQIVRESVPKGPPSHQAEHYLEIARRIGGDLNAMSSIPRGSSGVSPNEHTGTVGLCPGAEYGPTKRWLPDRFAAVAAAVANATPVHWLIFGTAKDAAVAGKIAASVGPGCTNLAGQTTIEQLIAELRRCRLLLTNDTGTMHLATLLGVPVVAVFGSTEPRLTGPLGSGNRVIRHQVECSPCFLRECPIDFRCMNAVTTAEVTAAVLSMLERRDRWP